MDKESTFRNAFCDLMYQIREVAEDENTDILSDYSRGRASAIHTILLVVDTVIETFEIDRSEVNLEGFNAEVWFEK